MLSLNSPLCSNTDMVHNNYSGCFPGIYLKSKLKLHDLACSWRLSSNPKAISDFYQYAHGTVCRQDCDGVQAVMAYQTVSPLSKIARKWFITLSIILCLLSIWMRLLFVTRKIWRLLKILVIVIEIGSMLSGQMISWNSRAHFWKKNERKQFAF